MSSVYTTYLCGLCVLPCVECSSHACFEQQNFIHGMQRLKLLLFKACMEEAEWYGAHPEPEILKSRLQPLLQPHCYILRVCLFSCGLPQALYIHTRKNVLIEVNPQVRLPRTFKRFCGLLVQLLQKLSIRATNGPDKLLKVRLPTAPTQTAFWPLPCNVGPWLLAESAGERKGGGGRAGRTGGPVACQSFF